MRSRFLSSLLFVAMLIPWTGYADTGDDGPMKAETTESDNPMYCHSGIQVSVNEDGYAVILPQMLLAQTYADYDSFVVSIVDPPLNTDTVTCDLVGMTIDVMVTNTFTGNSCWSEATIEDKLDPTITCDSVILPCWVDPFALPDSVLPSGYADNCTDSLDLVLSYTQSQDALDCSVDPYVLRIVRHWTVRDESGNTSSCDQVILIENASIMDLVLPADTFIECPATNTDVSVTGEPTINGQPFGNLCMWVYTFQDVELPKCGNSYVLRRTFMIANWCTGNMIMHEQDIHVVDETPPTIYCPPDMTIQATANCEADFVIPTPNATDLCADDSSILFTYYVDGVVTTQNVSGLSLGVHTIKILGYDPCYNLDSCEFTVEVVDTEPPVLSCSDSVMVTLDQDGYVILSYRAFMDNWYYDNCEIVDTMIRRVDTDCGDPNDQIYGDSISFCCEDLFQGVMVGIKITDHAGLENECMFIVTVKDNFGPMIVCPPDMTIECTQVDDSLYFGSPTINTACPFTLDSIEEIQVDDCGRGAITRTFMATSSSGNIVECIQTITIINPFDFTNDSLMFPNDTILTACIPDTSVNSVGYPVILDNFCGNIEVTYSDSIDTPPGGCLTLYRAWNVMNACDSVAMFNDVQEIVMKNQVAPDIIAPPGGTFYVDENCEVDIDLPPAIVDSCSTDITVSNDYNGQGGDINDVFTVGDYQIIFTAENLCGLIGMDTTFIVVLDTISPQITCPADVTLNCPADTSTSNTGLATATDNCTVDPVISYTDVVVPGSCDGNFSITRTFTAEDAYGNSTSCSQTIVVQDTTAPVITCPVDVTLDCPADTSPANTGAATATDECTGAPVITYIDAVTPACGNTYAVLRTWTAVDECGNDATCVQTIVVEDVTAPVITCPVDVTLDCPADTSPANTGTATATDECTGTPVITYSDAVTPACGNTYTVLRTWTAVDECGNDATCVQTIVVEDVTAPVITCPVDVTLDCPADTSPASTGTATATDECTGTPVITYSDAVTPACGNTYTVLRTWTAVDECGNDATCVQTIVVQDTTAPIIVCPVDVTLDCPADTSPANTGVATATDECTGVPVITYSDAVTPACGNTYTVLRTWTAVDECGNDATCIQTIVVEDVTAPVITCPVDVTLDCPADTSPASTGTATATEECGGAAIITYSDAVLQGGCDGVFTVTRTWIATDGCGNDVTCVQTIVVQDTTAPVLTCPADMTLDCPADTTPANTGMATATDACNTPSITYSDVVTPGSCPNTFSVVRTWITTDPCGNSASCDQLIEVIDETDPIIICPPDTTIDCTADTSPASTGVPIATDECSADVIVAYSDSVATGTGGVVFVITRTWTATDSCGNEASCEQIISVIDNTPPSITCPDDITAFASPDSCSIFVSVPEAVASDNCGAVTVVNDGNGDGLLDASGIYPVGVTVITYIATDDQGNADTCTTTITVLDTISPLLACPADTTIDCMESFFPLSQFGMPTFSDNCPGVTITDIDSVINISACGTGDITRTFTVTDASGNSSLCSQLITITGATMLDSLDFIWPDPIVEVYDCIDFEDIPLTGPELDPGIVFCGVITIDSVVVEIVPPTLGCETYEVTYTVTDSCEFDPNTGDGQWIFVQTVGIFDTVAPMIVPIVPGMYFADSFCEATVTLPDVTATDNCGGVTITNNSPFANSNGPNASGVYPGGSTPVTFFAEDDCGNIDSFLIDIFVADTTSPFMICLKKEYQITDQLNVIINVDTVITAFSDNCTGFEDITITFDLNDLSDTLLEYDCNDVGMIFFEMVYSIDEQGNIDSCEAELGIDDPNMFCPSSLNIDVGGHVATSLDESIADVEVMLRLDEQVEMSDIAGDFMFEDITSSVIHRLDASKSDPYLNGVTAYDLSLMMRHIADIEKISDPYLYYAADVNGDQLINIKDVLELRKLLLGIQDDLPVPSWTFYDAHYDLSTATNPFYYNVPDHVMVYHQREDMYDADFIGVKTADLDHSADIGFGGDTRSSEITSLLLGVPEREVDGSFLVPLYAGKDRLLQGGQFEIQLRNTADILDIIPNEELRMERNEVNYALLDRRTIRCAWIAEEFVSNVNEPLLWIKLSAVDGLSPDDWTLKPDFVHEVFDVNSQKYGVELETMVDHDISTAETFALYQNIPNPFMNTTTIQFNLPNAEPFELLFYDVKGSLLHRIEQDGHAGLNQVLITGSMLKGYEGVLYYSLQTADNHAVKKMISKK